MQQVRENEGKITRAALPNSVPMLQGSVRWCVQQDGHAAKLPLVLWGVPEKVHCAKSALECIVILRAFRFRRFWIPVFKELLLKHCLKTVEELIQITDRGLSIIWLVLRAWSRARFSGDVADSDSSELDRFRSKIKELLFFLQDIAKYNAAVKKMRAEMDNIGADDCIL